MYTIFQSSGSVTEIETVEMKVFLKFFLVDERIRICTNKRNRIQETQKFSSPTDTDPEHCYLQYKAHGI
jgi:hypothetical protein